MPPTGHPGSGSPRARDLRRRSHVSKEGRLVRVRVLTKTGVRTYRVRQSRLERKYRRVYTSVQKRESAAGLRKGTRLLVPTRKVLEVMVYGLARDRFDDQYAFLDEDSWVFHFRPSTNPDRVTSIILERFKAAGKIVVDPSQDAPGAYRPFTIASQVVDATDRDLTTLRELPEEVDRRIAQLEFMGRGGAKKKGG